MDFLSAVLITLSLMIPWLGASAPLGNLTLVAELPLVYDLWELRFDTSPPRGFCYPRLAVATAMAVIPLSREEQGTKQNKTSAWNYAYIQISRILFKRYTFCKD